MEETIGLWKTYTRRTLLIWVTILKKQASKSERNYVSEKLFGSKRSVGPKKFRFKKTFGPQKMLRLKKIVSPKIFLAMNHIGREIGR